MSPRPPRDSEPGEPTQTKGLQLRLGPEKCPCDSPWGTCVAASLREEVQLVTEFDPIRFNESPLVKGRYAYVSLCALLCYL